MNDCRKYFKKSEEQREEKKTFIIPQPGNNYCYHFGICLCTYPQTHMPITQGIVVVINLLVKEVVRNKWHSDR